MRRLFQSNSRGRSLILTLGFVMGIGVLFFGVMRLSGFGQAPSYSEQEGGFEEAATIENVTDLFVHPRLRGLENWERPAGPLRVGLQVGHWQAAEAPDELENLRTRTGTSGGGTTEWQVNVAIAEETKKLLEAAEIIVDILPVTIPENYWADAFVAIHADGNTNPAVSGYKVAAPWRDYSGRSQELADLMEARYGLATQLELDANISRAMRGYYAFNWRKYDHSIHPMTPAVIIETGFLTNSGDRRIIVNNPQLVAQGIADAVIHFVEAPPL